MSKAQAEVCAKAGLDHDVHVFSSWTAKFCNKDCQRMYDRLKEKGKPERVIKIAIANKLLKQAFAVIKNNMDFDENYLPKPCF